MNKQAHKSQIKITDLVNKNLVVLTNDEMENIIGGTLNPGVADAIISLKPGITPAQLATLNSADTAGDLNDAFGTDDFVDTLSEFLPLP